MMLAPLVLNQWGQREKEKKKRKGGGSLFQRLHTVPINSCENGDGSCWAHEVILQAWMEYIGL